MDIEIQIKYKYIEYLKTYSTCHGSKTKQNNLNEEKFIQYFYVLETGNVLHINREQRVLREK